MFYKKLLNHLILNQEDRLNFNLGKIQATINKELINFSSENKRDIVIQAIKFCKLFKKVEYKDLNDFQNTRGIGSNCAHQALISHLHNEISQNFITGEFLGAFLLNLADETEEDINFAFILTTKNKKFKNFEM